MSSVISGETISSTYGAQIQQPLSEVGPAVLSQLVHAYGDDGPYRCSAPPECLRSLAASGLQKSIRRGLVNEALFHCDQLLQIGPEYLFRRLHTVACEDVGIADLLLLAAYAVGGGSKTHRKKLGGDKRVGRALVSALARSPKDRLSDELKTLDLRELGRLAEPWNRAVAKRSDEQLLAEVADRSQPVTSRAISLMYFTRFEPSDRNALVSRSGPRMNWRHALMEVCTALDAPKLLRELCWTYAGRMVERQAYCLPLAWDISKDEAWALEDDPAISDLTLGNLLAAAVDGHTREGKEALANLVRRDAEARSLAIGIVSRASWDIRAFHLAFFRTEGHLCRRRLANPISARIRQLSTDAVVAQYCRSPAHASQLLANAPRLAPSLHHERIAAMRNWAC